MTMVTREAVFQAAQKISEGGTRPSQAKIRAILGGGSYSDIAPMLRDWRAMQKATGASPAMEMPEEAVVALNDLGKRLWSILSAQTATMMEAARRALEAQRAELEQDSADQQEALTALEAENAEMAALITQMRQERAPMEALVRELGQQNGRLEAQLEAERASSNRLATESSDLRDRHIRQEEEIASLRGQVLDLTERQAGTQSQWTATEARNDELVAENNRLHDRVERAEGRADFAEARADRLREDLEGRTADNVALRDQIVAAHAKHQEELGRLKILAHRALAQQKLEAGQLGAKTAVSKPVSAGEGSGADAAQRQ